MNAITAVKSETLILNDENDTEFVEMIETQCGACFGIFSFQELFIEGDDPVITCPYCKNEMRNVNEVSDDDILTPKYEFQE